MLRCIQADIFGQISHRDDLISILVKKLHILRKELRWRCYPRMLVIRNAMKYQNDNLAIAGLLDRIEDATGIGSIRIETRNQKWTIR